YRYVGKFTTYRVPEFAPHANLGAFTQIGMRDVLVTFEPGEQNPDLAAINNFYFNNLPSGGIFTQNFEELVARGVLRNGDSPRELYDMWFNVGHINVPNASEYSKRQNDQIRLTALGSADINQHAIQLGVEYEQLTQRRYDLNPVQSWTRARQLANFHIQEWQDPETTPPTSVLPGPTPFYFYQRQLGEDQPNFDRNLREALGLDPNGLDF